MLQPSLEALTANKIQLLYEVKYLPAGGAAANSSLVNQWVDDIIAADPDLVIFMAATTQPGDIDSAAALVERMRVMNYAPKAIIMPGGGAFSTKAIIDTYPGRAGLPVADGAYMYSSTYLHFDLRDPSYDAKTGTGADAVWEPYPSDGKKLSHQVLRDEYIADWGDTSPQSLYTGNIFPMVVQTLLITATKLFFITGTDDPALMVEASKSMSLKSACGLIQFDQYGIFANNVQYVVQQDLNGLGIKLITPLDSGVPDIYPFPSWDERIPVTEGGVGFLGTSTEKGVVAVTTIVLGYLLALAGGVIYFRRAASIKSASPPFPPPGSPRWYDLRLIELRLVSLRCFSWLWRFELAPDERLFASLFELVRKNVAHPAHL